LNSGRFVIRAAIMGADLVPLTDHGRTTPLWPVAIAAAASRAANSGATFGALIRLEVECE
jgi:hypothetical protein